MACIKCLDLDMQSSHGSSRSFACGLKDNGGGGKRWECVNYAQWRELYDKGELPDQKWSEERKWLGGLHGNAERDRQAHAKSASKSMNSFNSTDDSAKGIWWEGVYYSHWDGSDQTAPLSKNAKKRARVAKAKANKAAEAEESDSEKAGLKSKSARKAAAKAEAKAAAKEAEIKLALKAFRKAPPHRSVKSSKSKSRPSSKSGSRSSADDSSGVSDSESSVVESDSDSSSANSQDDYVNPKRYNQKKKKRKKSGRN